MLGQPSKINMSKLHQRYQAHIWKIFDRLGKYEGERCFQITGINRDNSKKGYCKELALSKKQMFNRLLTNPCHALLS